MTSSLRYLAILAVITAQLCSVPATLAAPPASITFHVTVVAPFSQRYRFGLGLNNAGHVTGETAGAQAFFYDGSLHTLGKPAGAKFSVGQGIADDDVIAATAQIGSVRHAYAVTHHSGRATWTQLAGLTGYGESEAAAILPDGSAITGALCATGDPACSHLDRHSLAVIWKRAGGGWSAPMVLATGKAPLVSSASGIARASRITVVTGEIVPSAGSGVNATAGQAVLWLLPGNRYFRLTGQGAYSVVGIRAIAHASGNMFYVAGTIMTPGEGTYGEPVLWTVTCTAAACRQTRLQVVTSLGEVYGVNGRGMVTGYQRVGGDPGGPFLWQNGTMLGDTAGMAINSAGQMVGWRIYPPGSRKGQVILLTPSS